MTITAEGIDTARWALFAFQMAAMLIGWAFVFKARQAMKRANVNAALAMTYSEQAREQLNELADWHLIAREKPPIIGMLYIVADTFKWPSFAAWDGERFIDPATEDEVEAVKYWHMPVTVPDTKPTVQ